LWGLKDTIEEVKDLENERETDKPSGCAIKYSWVYSRFQGEIGLQTDRIGEEIRNSTSQKADVEKKGPKSAPGHRQYFSLVG